MAGCKPRAQPLLGELLHFKGAANASGSKAGAELLARADEGRIKQFNVWIPGLIGADSF